MDAPNVKMVCADLRDKDDVNKALYGMDIVIQAAATTSGVKEIINKPYHPKDEPRYIEQRLETSEVSQTPIYINKRTGIR